jgi:hypothetical protein
LAGFKSHAHFYTQVRSSPPDTRRLGGTLKVVTTHLQPGYLRNNGVPYSANIQHRSDRVRYDVHGRKGAGYLVVTQIVDDPKYLNVPWITSNSLPARAGWREVGSKAL